MATGLDVARTARVAAWCLAVSLVVSRGGLVLHELLGHGAAAFAVGGRVTDLHLYWFAGGWIEYGGVAAWSPTAIAIVSLAGVGIELATALAIAARARGRPAWTATAWGLVVHAAGYLAVGAADGIGDGVWIHRQLGAARGWVAVPAVVVAAAAAAVASRRLGGWLLAIVSGPSLWRRRGWLAAAIVATAASHGALVVGELAARPDPTYERVMASERTRAIDRELTAWRAEAAARGELDAAQERAARRAIAAAHRETRFAPWITAAIAIAAVLGLVRARPQADAVPAPRLSVAVVAAALAVAVVAAIDLAARAIW